MRTQKNVKKCIQLKVKQAATDFTYIVIIGFGAVMLCVIGYFLFSELFTRETPSGIYDESSKICLDNFQVIFCMNF